MLCLSLEASSSDISEAGMLGPNWSGTEGPGVRPAPSDSDLLLEVSRSLSLISLEGN